MIEIQFTLQIFTPSAYEARDFVIDQMFNQKGEVKDYQITSIHLDTFLVKCSVEIAASCNIDSRRSNKDDENVTSKQQPSVTIRPRIQIHRHSDLPP